MSKKLKEISELFLEIHNNITDNTEEWRKFLTTAGRFPKYDFKDQLLIFAQKPDAVACASLNIWNERMNRWIKSGSKGIALLRESEFGRPKLEYVFDLSDTREIANAKTPFLWELREENEEILIEKLSQIYSELEFEKDFVSNIMEICEIVVNRNYFDFLQDLKQDLGDSFLEGFDDYNIEFIFKNAIVVSTQYMVLSRCNIEPMDYLEDEDFKIIYEFNTIDSMSHLGEALNTSTSEILLAIGKIMKEYNLNNVKNKVKFKEEQSYGEERNISSEWGLSNTEHNNKGGEPPRKSGQIWNAETDVFEKPQERDLLENDDARHSMGAYSGDRQNSTSRNGQINGKHDDVRGRDRRIESTRPDVMGAKGKQYQSTSRGNSDKRTDIQLKDFISTPNGVEDIKNILMKDTHYKNKLEEIYIKFTHYLSEEQCVEYIKNIINTEYTEISIDNERFGYKANDEYLTVWKGAYLSREYESKLSWNSVADMFHDKVLPSFVEKQNKREKEISIFPTVMEQIESIVETKAEDKNSVFSFTQKSQIPSEVIDKIIGSGSNSHLDTSLVAGYLAYNSDLVANAKYIQNYYGVGGKGFEIDGEEYALWFDEKGLQIARGNSVFNTSSKINLTWEQVAEKIAELLENGEYVSVDELAKSKDTYIEREAELFLYMYGDKQDTYKNEILDTLVTQSNHLKRVEVIKSNLSDKEKLNNLIYGLEQMEEAHNNTERGVMRLRLYNPTKTLNRLKGLLNDPVEFKANNEFKRVEATFITEDELDNIYNASSKKVKTSNIDTYAFFKQANNQKEKAEYLKNKYGYCGICVSNVNITHSGKGTEYLKGNILKPYASVHENWSQVAKRIDRLINENRYLSKAEVEYIPTYEKQQVAQSILLFYNYAPKDIEKPFGNQIDSNSYVSKYENNFNEIVIKLDDKEFVDSLIEKMESIVSLTLANEQGFDSMESSLDKVKQFQNGTFSIFDKEELIKNYNNTDLDNNVSIEKLEDKIKEKGNVANEQLTLDLFNTEIINREVSNILEAKRLMVSDELIEYAKENLNNPSASDIAEKVESIIAEDEKLITSNVKTIMYSDIANMIVKNSPDFVDREMNLYINEEGKEFVFGYGSIGNGTLVWNYLEEVDGDYKTVGHIDDDGVTNWLDDEIPDSAKVEILRNTEAVESFTELKDNSFINNSLVTDEILHISQNTIDEYLKVKYDNVNDVIGVIADNKLIFYGEDATIVAPVLRIEAVERDTDILGYTNIVSDDINNLDSNINNLCESGIDFKLIKDGNIVKENKAKDYIPLGMELDINGRKFEIDSINYELKEVSLKDVSFRNNIGFPIFRSESISFVRHFVEDKQLLERTLRKDVETNIATSKNKEDVIVDEVDYDFGSQVILPTFDKQKEVSIENNTPKVNYIINNNELGFGTFKEKFNHNINAIKTLKLIESEKRLATPEEQEILSKYVGWGGLAEAFDDNKTNWSNEYKTLKDLLSDDEYKSARASTLNAHYTPPIVINSMYEALEQMGIPEEVNIIDPALGTGHFMGMLPNSLKNSNFYGTELDSLTGRIAKQLYQNSDIQIKGFEKANYSDNFFDIAVGNVPFGNYKINDRRYDKQNFLIHDYFFAKTLDKVRVGGVIAFITSKGTLDKQSVEVRKYLAQKADLLGAIRLPNTAFKANAGTEVTSDIIFLQKRDHAPEIIPGWVNVALNEEGILINQYFIDNPQMIMGKMEMVSGPFGLESTCKANNDKSLEEQLKQANKFINKPNLELLNKIKDINNNEKDTSIPATPNVKNFSYTIINNKAYYRENSRMNEVQLSDKAFTRLKELIKLRDKTREVIQLQLDECTNEELDVAQKELNIIYDNYNKKFGLVNSRSSKSAFIDDVSYPLLCSLEKLDEDGNLEAKADMFTKRTIKQNKKITSVDTPIEALAVSISEKAGVDISFMAELLGGQDKVDTVISELKGIIFKSPYADDKDKLSGWQTSDEYLSGNVRKKLEIAREKAEINTDFAINVEMLEKVQPKELLATEIDVRIGATWIDQKYYRQFMYELLETPRYMQNDKINIHYSKHTGEWNVKGKSVDSGNPKSYGTFGTKRRSAYHIIEDSLNLRDTRIFDVVVDDDGKERRVINGKETTLVQQKQEAIGEAFKEWIWKDPERREKLSKKYNQIFNAIRPREFDGQHITFDGMSPFIKLNPHQYNAVARSLYGGNTLLAHCVGAGKTFTMIASAMESKRLGLSQKSLFVVPNHLTEQMGSDIYELYPGAKVLVATKKDFEPNNRKEFCSRIATGDFDIVVIGHSQYEKIPLSAAKQEAILEKQIEDIMLAISDANANDAPRYTVKQLEKTKKSLETKLEKLATQERKDSVITFEELGVDKLYVDEAHLFKNLFLHTKMRNVAGIGQTEAQKSTDMFTKCRYMDEITDGKGTVFATGTPVSNSMVELYTMMRYLQYGTLENLDLTHFDSWAANFGEKVTAIELAPEGTGFRAKTRFAKFFNLPELINIWKEAADIQTADMLKLKVPTAEYITVVTKPSTFQIDMVKNLATRANLVRKREVEPHEDNMLRITSDGRKLALDQRLHNDMLSDNPDSKTNECVKNVLKIMEETNETNGTQIIFCDLSTPHNDGRFNVYDDIKNKLISNGVKSDEIAFVHNAKTEKQKDELFAKVRKGRVRVIIGSTLKMGAGTNIQTKLVALHHLDCPWRPADLEQREGRIVRQKNENENVKIFKYVTENTFDAYNWSIIENKQKFIGQIFTSKSPARSADDIDATALSYAEVKALATGDPRIKEKMDLDIQVAKLKLMRSSHNTQCYEMEDRVIKYYPKEIKKTSELINGLKADIEVAKSNPSNEDNFIMNILGKSYTDKKLAGEVLIHACKQLKNSDEKVDLGSFRGFDMLLYMDKGEFAVSLKNVVTHRAELENNITGNIIRINNALESMQKKLERLEERLETLNNEMESAKIESKRPFPKEQEYKEKSKRLAELNIELDSSQEENDSLNEKTDDIKNTKKPLLLERLKNAKNNVMKGEKDKKNNNKDLDSR